MSNVALYSRYVAFQLCKKRPWLSQLLTEELSLMIQSIFSPFKPVFAGRNLVSVLIHLSFAWTPLGGESEAAAQPRERVSSLEPTSYLCWLCTPNFDLVQTRRCHAALPRPFEGADLGDFVRIETHDVCGHHIGRKGMGARDNQVHFCDGTRHGRLRVGLLVIVFSPIIGIEKMILGILS